MWACDVSALTFRIPWKLACISACSSLRYACPHDPHRLCMHSVSLPRTAVWDDLLLRTSSANCCNIASAPPLA